MCEYCEKEKPICNEIDEYIEIIKNSILVQRRIGRIGNVFDVMTCETKFNINYCPMCR